MIFNLLVSLFLQQQVFIVPQVKLCVVDDMPAYRDELFIEFVNSSEVHAKIMNIDASKALELET